MDITVTNWNDERKTKREKRQEDNCLIEIILSKGKG